VTSSTASTAQKPYFKLWLFFLLHESVHCHFQRACAELISIKGADVLRFVVAIAVQGGQINRAEVSLHKFQTCRAGQTEGF
jgi:hypothetical protein